MESVLLAHIWYMVCNGSARIPDMGGPCQGPAVWTVESSLQHICTPNISLCSFLPRLVGFEVWAAVCLCSTRKARGLDCRLRMHLVKLP